MNLIPVTWGRMFLFARQGVVFGTLLGLQENLPNLIISLIVLVELTEDIGISSRETRVRSSLADFNGFHQPIILAFTQQSWTLIKRGGNPQVCAV